MPYPFVAEIDMTKVHFGPMVNDGKQKVEIHKDNTSTKSSNKLIFNLCRDPREPFGCRFKLDTVREDQDGSRRGLIVKLEDHNVLAALQALDDHVIAHAMKNCKEFFKKSSMTEADVRLRYKPLVLKVQEDDDFHCTKFKVKCKGWATELHLLHDDMTIETQAGSLDHISQYGACVAPILSAYALWFMGGGTSFGITIQAEKMVVKPGTPRPALSDFCSRTPIVVTQKRSREEDAPHDDEGDGNKQMTEGGVELEEDDSPM
jgi:hypothetical protein